MPNVLAIDPGPKQSAFVAWNGEKLLFADILENESAIELFRQNAFISDFYSSIAIEMIASYGMSVGAEVFETCVWIGRYAEAISRSLGIEPSLVYRREVKMHVCSSPRANDATIRQALVDRFGKPGTKKNPGRTYGLRKDLWQAFALAVTVHDQTFQSTDKGEQVNGK